jgi:hypothetical protein
MQLYVSGKPRDASVAVSAAALTTPCNGVLRSYHFHLNGDKFEIVWFSSHSNLRALAVQDLTLAIDPEVVLPPSL